MAATAISRDTLPATFVIDPKRLVDPAKKIGAVLAEPVWQVARAVDGAKKNVEMGVGLAADKVGIIDKRNGETAGPISGSTLLKVGQKTYSAAMKVLKALPETLFKGLKVLKSFDFKVLSAGMFFSGLIFFPGTILDVVKAPFAIIRATNIRDRLSAAFKGIGSVSDLTGTVITAMTTLFEFGLIGARAVAWIPIAGPILSALGVVGIAVNAFGMDDAYSVKRDLDRILGDRKSEATSESVRRALSYLAEADTKFLKSQFNIDYDVTKDAQTALKRLEAGEDIEADARRLLSQLRGRIDARMTAFALKMVSSAVGLIALPLILSGGAAPVGAGVAAVGAVIGVAGVIHEVRSFARQPVRFED